MDLGGIIQSLTTNEIVAGAILGSILLPIILHIMSSIYRKYDSTRPANAVLGQFRDNEVECLIFLKELYDMNRQNMYLYKVPDYFPPHSTNQEEVVPNVPRVFAKADAECVNDVTNVLGMAGKNRNIRIASIETEWDKWNTPYISVGGNYKTAQIFKRCEPIYLKEGKGNVRINGKKTKLIYFKLTNRNEKLFAITPNDYGVIHKTRDNGKDVLLIMGLGYVGTASTGRFFRDKFTQLGKMYGGDPFAVVIKSSILQGKESYELYDYQPEPKLRRKIMHPLAWLRIFRPVKIRVAKKHRR